MSLAINGGEPVRRNPLEFKPWIEEEDIKLVGGDIIRSGNLSSLHGGEYNAQLEEELARYLGGLSMHSRLAAAPPQFTWPSRRWGGSGRGGMRS